MSTLAAFVAAFLLPGFAQVSTTPRGGQVWSGVFPGGARESLVYLPPEFTPTRRYAVVYLLHGMPGSPSEFVSGAGLVETAESGTLRPFIAVMPAAGDRRRYNGEWAGTWETYLVRDVVPFVDAYLPTIAAPSGRVLAGLSAGGYGAVDIGLHHPELFGRIESWSGYYRPLPDGPFKDASIAFYIRNDPEVTAQAAARRLRRDGTAFFISSGPSHSHWFKEAETVAFARELRRLGLPVSLHLYASRKGEWRAQLEAGLQWAFGETASR